MKGFFKKAYELEILMHRILEMDFDGFNGLRTLGHNLEHNVWKVCIQDKLRFGNEVSENLAGCIDSDKDIFET